MNSNQQISDEKDAIQKLIESEERWRSITKYTPDHILMMDRDAKILFINYTVPDLSIDEVIGRPIFDFVPKEYHDLHRNVYDELLNNGEPCRFETGYVDKDGKQFYFEIHSGPVWKEGKIIGIINRSTDITERKITEQKLIESEERLKKLNDELEQRISERTEELRESEEKFRGFLDYGNIGMAITSVDKKWVYCNDQICEILGFTREELFEKTWADLSYPEDLQSDFEQFNKILEGKIDSYQIEKRYIKKNGEIAYTHLTVSCVRNSDRTVKHFLATLQNITERKKAEQKLKESEENFRNITEQSLMGICIVQDDVIKFANQRMVDISGYSLDEIMNWQPKEFYKIIATESLDFVSEQAKKKQLGLPDVIPQYTLQVIKKSRERIWIENFSKTINYNGRPADLVTLFNITDKVEAEQKLKESEERWKALSENSPAHITMFNREHKIIFINHTVPDLTKEEVIGTSVYTFVPQEFHQLARNSINSVWETGEPVSYPTNYITKEGDIRFFDNWVGPVFQSGKIFALVSHSMDVTEKKEAELKLKDSEEKFKMLFNNANDAIIIIDLEGKIIECNQTLIDRLGYTRKEILHMSPRDFISSQYVASFKNRLGELQQKGEAFYESAYVRKDMSVVPIELNSKIINFEEKSAILSIARDITERKKAENELKELSKLKSEFLRRASHELKTPLISIKGFSDLILSLYTDQLDPAIISKLREINDGCERLQNIINNLLKTSRLESPDLKPKLQKEDLSFLIKFCVHELESLSERRNQMIKLDILSDLYANIEKEEIHDVISNLLTNAIKYTPPMGKIKIRAELKEDFVVISVRDNGIGFTNEQKKIIFQQFGKIERYGQGLDLGIDGTGLGLYISKRIVESHGGKIWMESEGKSRGSTFYFTLPTV